MDYNPEECPVCMTVFDDTEQRPHNLPCGHTFCTLCLSELEKQRRVTCPTCRVKHAVPEAGHFPICYTLEAVLRRLSDASKVPPHKAWQRVSVARRADHVEGGLCRRMRSLLQEEEDKVLAAISTCQEVQSQLGQYKVTLAGWGDQQEQLEDRLQAAISLVQSASMLVRQEQSQVIVREEHMQQIEQLLQTRLETMRKVNTKQEACEAIKDVDQFISSTEHIMEECQQMFPGMDTVTVVRKVRDASGEAVEAIHKVNASFQKTGVPIGDEREFSPLTDTTFTIMDRFHALLTPTLGLEEVCSLRQPARNLLEAGLVVAVDQVEGRHRHARISLEKDQLYLHSLQDQRPPLGTATIQMGELVLPSPPCVAFLDLAWPGSAARRVLIHMSSDTARGRQFAMLCTGQRGPSYANTKLCGVVNRGMPGEWVWGGDYDRNTGEGGASLLPDLDVGQYLRSGRPGDVWGAWGGDPAQGAQFGINTTERHDGYLFYGVFGQVVSGLDAVAAAAAVRTTEVTVVDCGVFLPTFT